MKTPALIFLLYLVVSQPTQFLYAQKTPSVTSFDFYGTQIEFTLEDTYRLPFEGLPSKEAVISFEQKLLELPAPSVVSIITEHRKKYQLDDWLYYQLIRKTVQAISPKQDNYIRYTLYKWYLLTQSGYNAVLRTNGEKLLLYVQTSDNIYNIPEIIQNGFQYACLNYHDYGGNINFETERFEDATVSLSSGKAFSYKVSRLPIFRAGDYEEKELHFNYGEKEFQFKIRLTRQVGAIFANYPSVDYESYFNIPLSDITYKSLIPVLKKEIRSLSVKNGVEYLMKFTRYAFLYKSDSEIYGIEKRLTPEQTLLLDASDCEDRAALFFYLVKEIYNLPMIVLAYPEHVTVAVKFEKAFGKPIIYNGFKYSICEPTSQVKDLPIGKLPQLSTSSYEVVYAYMPGHK